MTTLFKFPLTRLTALLTALLAALLLASCGGDPGGTAASAPVRLAGTTQGGSAPSGAPGDYVEVVEQLYIAYFGRPADSSGLANFSAQLAQLGAPAGIQDLNAAYAASASVRQLIDSFGVSAESQALYPGDNDAFVTAIYQNVLNRQPDAPGKAFWVDALNAGVLTRANASLSIMAAALINASAQGLLDAQLVRNRVVVGTNFTTALDTPAEASAYSGDAAAAAARAMLATVDANTSPAAFQATVEATIAALLPSAGPAFAEVRAIVNARCVSCHGSGIAQAGLRLDSDAAIRANAQSIYFQAVVQRTMPLGNATGMTDAERQLIGAWFQAGAH